MAVLLVVIGLSTGDLVLTARVRLLRAANLQLCRSDIWACLVCLVMVLIGWGLFYFSRQAYLTLPKIAETTIPPWRNCRATRASSCVHGSGEPEIARRRRGEGGRAGAGRHAREAAFQFVSCSSACGGGELF